MVSKPQQPSGGPLQAAATVLRYRRRHQARAWTRRELPRPSYYRQAMESCWRVSGVKSGGKARGGSHEATEGCSCASTSRGHRRGRRCHTAVARTVSAAGHRPSGIERGTRFEAKSFLGAPRLSGIRRNGREVCCSRNPTARPIRARLQGEASSCRCRRCR